MPQAQQLVEHIRETEQQSRLEALPGELDKSHSSLKDMALSAVGSLATIRLTAAFDECVKNSFADFAFESFEIAAHKSLRTLAQLGVQACDFGYRLWLEKNLASVTRKFASLSKAGLSAKV